MFHVNLNFSSGILNFDFIPPNHRISSKFKQILNIRECSLHHYLTIYLVVCCCRFYKTRLIIRCSRELSAGSELSNCYGPHRAREPTQHRRAQLRAQYMFTCNCVACTDTERGDFVVSLSLLIRYQKSIIGILMVNRANCFLNK